MIDTLNLFPIDPPRFDVERTIPLAEIISTSIFVKVTKKSTLLLFEIKKDQLLVIELIKEFAILNKNILFVG